MKAVKRHLQSMDLHDGMFFQAILAATHNAQPHSFTAAQDAEKCVQRIKGDATSTSAQDDEEAELICCTMTDICCLHVVRGKQPHHVMKQCHDV